MVKRQWLIKLCVFVKFLMTQPMASPYAREVMALRTISIHGKEPVEPLLCVVGGIYMLGNSTREMHWKHPVLCLQIEICSACFFVCTMATRQRNKPMRGNNSCGELRARKDKNLVEKCI